MQKPSGVLLHRKWMPKAEIDKRLAQMAEHAKNN